MDTTRADFRPISLRLPLMRAAFLSGEAGAQAFELWRSQVDLYAHLDPVTFRLLPQLHRNLTAWGSGDAFVKRLAGIARRNWYENQRFFTDFTPLLRSLHEAGIPCIPLSGAALFLRGCHDYPIGAGSSLPVLVREGQAQQAIRTLEHLGWLPERPLPDGLIEAHLAAARMHAFHDPAGRQVRLHWRLLPAGSPAGAETELWVRTSVAAVHGVPVRKFDPADHLLLACLEEHPAAEDSSFLQAIDAMFVIRSVPAADWGRLSDLAGSGRLALPLQDVLGFIQANLEAPLPPDIWERVHLQPVSRRGRRAYRLETRGPRVWRRFWVLWSDYRSREEAGSLIRDLLRLPRRLQHYWLLPGLLKVPGRIFQVFARRLRHRLWRFA